MMRRLFFAVLLASATSAFAQTQNSAVFTSNATVNITTGISITRVSDLLFGDIVPSTTSAGTVVISPVGVRTPTTVTLGNGPYGNATFDIQKSGGGNPHFTVTLPATVTISNGAANMTVDTFTSDYPATNAAQKLPFTLHVGATLHVAANQATGSYSGTFNVTAVQQ